VFTDSSESVQLNDFSPGNVPGGVFWTVPIPSRSVEVDLHEGEAVYALHDFKTRDFGDFCTNLAHGTSLLATVSFTLRWSGKTKEFQIVDETTGFRGEFVQTGATMEWVATEEAAVFASAPATTSHSIFSVIGTERNGVFFE
jgi:hypothetical protein